MTTQEHSFSTFHLYLKLGLWRSGQVSGWGRIETVSVSSDGTTDKGFFIRKSPEDSLRSPRINKPLAPGLFLLDMYSLTANSVLQESVHVAVIAVCKATMDSVEAIHCLRITSRTNAQQFRKAVQNATGSPEQMDVRSASGYYRRKRKHTRTGNRIDTSPIHAYTRKY
jgi:hypothetical protein